MEFAISRFNLHSVKDNIPEAASLEIKHTEDLSLRLLQISLDLGKMNKNNQN